MFASHMGTVLKQALTTFSNKHDVFYQNVEILKSLLNKTTAQDVNLQEQLMSESLWRRPNKAPVTYINIFEDYSVSIGIFVLKPNMKLPLHNHPAMHGLLKVVAGKLKVTSYSLNTNKTQEIENRQRQPGFTRYLTVERTQNALILDENSDCCLLEPEMCNLHEIESVGGPAAFIDILSPPYETTIEAGRVRKCSYYQILREIEPSVFRLEEIHSPSWYWTDLFPYTGPEMF